MANCHFRHRLRRQAGRPRRNPRERGPAGPPQQSLGLRLRGSRVDHRHRRTGWGCCQSNRLPPDCRRVGCQGTTVCSSLRPPRAHRRAPARPEGQVRRQPSQARQPPRKLSAPGRSRLSSVLDLSFPATSVLLCQLRRLGTKPAGANFSRTKREVYKALSEPPCFLTKVPRTVISSTTHCSRACWTGRKSRPETRKPRVLERFLPTGKSHPPRNLTSTSTRAQVLARSQKSFSNPMRLAINTASSRLLTPSLR